MACFECTVQGSFFVSPKKKKLLSGNARSSRLLDILSWISLSLCPPPSLPPLPLLSPSPLPFDTYFHSFHGSRNNDTHTHKSEKEPGKSFLLFTFLFFQLEGTDVIFSFHILLSSVKNTDWKLPYLDFNILSVLCGSFGNIDNPFPFKKNCHGTQPLGH